MTCVESVPRVFATLYNNGIDDAGEVILQVFSGDSLIASNTWNDVDAGSEVNYEYEIPEVPVHGGLNELRAVVSSMTYGVEYDTYNNSSMLRFNKYYYSEFPFTIDFNAGGYFSNYGMVVENPNELVTWNMLPWGEDSSHNALGYRYSKNMRYNDMDYVYLPQTDLPDADSIFFNFLYAYRNRLTSTNRDSLFVEVSTDCGATFPYRVWSRGGLDMCTQEGSGSYYVPVDYAEFDTISVSLAEFRGQSVMVRLVAKNGRNSDLYISQIMLDNLCLSGNREYSIANIEPKIDVYPNPTDGFVNIFIPSEYIGTRACIYDVCGKIVREIIVDNQDVSVDMSGCTDGVYFLRIEGTDVREKIVLLKK